MTPLLAPSLLSADFSRLADDIAMVAEAGADQLHLDVMDGHFVPNITFGPLIVKAVRKVTRLPLDVHLMIEQPDRYAEEFIRAGADWLSVHVEACPHLQRLIHLIKSHKVKAGVALNPSTPVSTLEEILPDLDFVLVMSVNPGFGGQQFIRSSLAKITKLRSLMNSLPIRIPISVDGGVGHGNTADLVAAGAEVLVAGNSVFGAADPRASVREFKKIMTQATGGEA